MHLSVLTILSIFSCEGFAIEKYPRVSFPKGSVLGKYMYTRGQRRVEAFLGIPYAKPPIGDLRFQPPQPDDPIIGDLKAQTHPHPCTQPSYFAEDSEDCLHLNVFTLNATAKVLKPVYVYIYGGVYYKGDTIQYTPDYFLDEDIVLVTFNFRVGLLGFLSTNDLIVPGNMGIKDARCALRWVKENISRFGGDPRKVTIGGNSSGASIVHTFLLFLEKEGLFRAGISESGTALPPYNFVPPQQIRWVVNNLASITSCPNDSIGLINCLRDKPAKDIVDIYEALNDRFYENNPQRVFKYLKDLPILGLVLEPACVEDRIITGNPWNFTSSLPFLEGVTSKEYLVDLYIKDDGETPINFTAFDAAFNFGFPLTTKYHFSSADVTQVPFAFRNFYLHNETFSMFNLESMVDGLSDVYVAYPSFESALRSNSNNTFFYFFDYVGPQSLSLIPTEDRIGAIHGDELYFLFPMYDGFIIRNTTMADVQLSKKLVKLWANFVTYLDPSPYSVEGIKWPPFHPNQSYLHIKQDGFEAKHMFFQKRMVFWKSQPYPFRDDIYGELTCYPIG